MTLFQHLKVLPLKQEALWRELVVPTLPSDPHLPLHLVIPTPGHLVLHTHDILVFWNLNIIHILFNYFYFDADIFMFHTRLHLAATILDSRRLCIEIFRLTRPVNTIFNSKKTFKGSKQFELCNITFIILILLQLDIAWAERVRLSLGSNIHRNKIQTCYEK